MKMKKYEVTFHFNNGDIKKILYKSLFFSKQEFLQQMCRGNSNAFTFFSDEIIENVVNINYVNYFEIKEVK